MMHWNQILRRHTLWLGLLVVLVPLAVLLVLQYRWLTELEHASALARQADLVNYLEAVRKDVEHRYEKAGWAIKLPPQVFTGEKRSKAALTFAKVSHQHSVARSYFIVSFVDPDPEIEGKPLFYDPESGGLVPRPWSEELRAVMVATASWRTLAHKWGKLEFEELIAEEHDPRYPILLRPMTDDSSRLVGVAGMVLDRGYLERELPVLLEKLLPKFFPSEHQRRDLSALVRDGRGNVIYGDPNIEADGKTRLSLVFTDWTLGLAGLQATEGKRARRNFLINVALSAALALVLLGGVVLALRTASKEMKLSQMKSDFVSNVSHELRTPLASIRVFGELLRLGRVASAEKIREYGEYIETESRRLTQLINNLLDFSRIESGRKSYHLELSDLEEVVAETLKTFDVRLRQRGFRVTYQGPQEPLPPLSLDAGALAQAISNLLDNAVKFSGGNREIGLTLSRRDGEVVISVQDWGIGIPRDEQDKIFERFHRVSTGLVHDVKGSGLGLAIVRHIALAHGGDVTVESRSGQGSTFSIHLPLESPPPAAGGMEGLLEGPPAAREPI